MVSPTEPIRGSTSRGVREGHVSVFISSVLEDPGARYLYKTSVVTEGGAPFVFWLLLAPPLRLVPRHYRQRRSPSQAFLAVRVRALKSSKRRLLLHLRRDEHKPAKHALGVFAGMVFDPLS